MNEQINFISEPMTRPAAAQFLLELRRRDVFVSLAGDCVLAIDAPKDENAGWYKRCIVEHKPAIVDALQELDRRLQPAYA